MASTTQQLRAERHEEVGEVIRRDAPLIIEKWARRAVEEEPTAARVHHRVLLNDLPAFLLKLAETLSESDGGNDCPHCGPAVDHGGQRWEAGWSLPEVVRDYQLLRQVLLEHLEAALGRPLRPRENQAVALALDEAIAASISAYVRHRDDEARRTEQELRRHVESLREADARKNQFLAVLAHELRSPLAPILNSVEALRLVGSTDPHVQTARDIVERQVKHVVRIVDDLLDVTRIAQGKLALRRSRFELAAAVAQAIQTTAALFEARGHQLSVLLPTEPMPLYADQARIVQVLVNLLTNAAKYTETGGHISLVAAREGDETVIRVRDSGMGIEPEMLGRVFDLFLQLDRGLRRSDGGLGIGLTLVRQLVELHGGRVEAHSEGPGKGSEFVVRLPAAAADAADPAPPPVPPAAAIRPRRVLIVEDNPDARSTLQTLLKLLGHEVTAAATGPDGLARAAAERPDVALIDISLPGMDGYQVAARLRADLGPAVLLVALTGHASEEDRRRALAAGFHAHLAKPVDLDELTRTLASATPS